MKDYLSIGKVSKLKNVSIKSLRYYDDIGIFKPAYVNQNTNYRYYKKEQLYILDAINLCIELGIPLKTLPAYQNTDGAWDFQKLLFDGKALAEDKIRAMRNSIDALQKTLRQIESGELDIHCEGQPASPSLPENTFLHTFEKRLILTVPFDLATSPERYNHKLLELFVGADKAGLKATYPAGLYYEQKNNVLSRYVFVHLCDKAGSLSPDSPFIIKELSGGQYLCSRSATHQIEIAHDVFHGYLQKNDDYELIEQTVTTEPSKETLCELQYLCQSPPFQVRNNI